MNLLVRVGCWAELSFSCRTPHPQHQFDHQAQKKSKGKVESPRGKLLTAQSFFSPHIFPQLLFGFSPSGQQNTMQVPAIYYHGWSNDCHIHLSKLPWSGSCQLGTLLCEVFMQASKNEVSIFILKWIVPQGRFGEIPHGQSSPTLGDDKEESF